MQQSHGTESSEDSPLLSSSVRNVSSPEIGHETGSEPLREKRSSKLIVILILLYLLLLDLGYEFIVPAQTQIFEQIYCKAYYKGHDLQWSRPGEPHGIDEKLCKIPIVQGQVARLKGWQTAFDSFGSEYMPDHLFIPVLARGGVQSFSGITLVLRARSTDAFASY